MNRGYKYIFTNIDIFSKYAYAFPLKYKKKYKILNIVLKKYLKKQVKIYLVRQRTSFF